MSTAIVLNRRELEALMAITGTYTYIVSWFDLVLEKYQDAEFDYFDGANHLFERKSKSKEHKYVLLSILKKHTDETVLRRG